MAQRGRTHPGAANLRRFVAPAGLVKVHSQRSPDDKPFSAVRVICFLSNLSFFSRKWLMPLTFETQTQHPAAARLQDPRAERCQRGASPGGSVSQRRRLGGLGGGCSFPTAPSRSISGMSGPTEATTLKPQSCSCTTELAGKGMAPGGTAGLGRFPLRTGTWLSAGNPSPSPAQLPSSPPAAVSVKSLGLNKTRCQ